MSYQQQVYAGSQAQLPAQVIKRPLSMEERQLPGNFYRGLQNGLRGLSLFCLILFVFSTYVMPMMISDPVTYDTLSIVLMVFMAVFGLVAIGMSVNAIVVRKKISRAMADGTGVEVFAPAYRTGQMKNGQGWSIGPISLVPQRGMERMLVEGMPTRVLCVPNLKAALSINNTGLKHGARIMCPPNLEAMAVPVGVMPFPSQPGMNPSPPDNEELPPPPPD